MKTLIPLLLCLLLCGCAEHAVPESEATITVATTGPAAEPVGMYDAQHPLEETYQGALRVYPLSMRKVQGLRTLGSDLLAFSGYGSTRLTLLTGEALYIHAETELPFELDARDASLQFHNGTLSYYDPQARETVVLDGSLLEVGRIPAPETCVGNPILSSDRNAVFYCTPEAILCWDLNTGIHRTVKEMICDAHTLAGLFLKDTVLQCRIQEESNISTLFLDTQTGRLLSRQEGAVSLITRGNRYYATLPADFLQLQVFGSVNEPPSALFPTDHSGETFFLPESHGAVTVSEQDTHIRLDYYDLASGLLLGSMSLDPLQHPKSIVSADAESLFILAYDPQRDCDTVYRWTIPDEPGTFCHTEAYRNSDSPDFAALAQCCAYAETLGQKYGLTILVGPDALAVQPWDYRFTGEYQPRILMQELQLMDRWLSQYPPDVLSQTAAHFASLRLCLVRQIQGTASADSLDTATGIQFLDGSDAYVVLSTGKYSRQALYHELFHVMETHILCGSTALDQWDKLNPPEFSYGGIFEEYLTGDGRAFVDRYSMISPREDRARILENAMLPGKEALFRPQILQEKLTRICTGIRESYGLKNISIPLPWEQYLAQPLAG